MLDALLLIDWIPAAIQLQDTDWQFEEALLQLKEELATIADSLRAEETKKMVVLIEVST